MITASTGRLAAAAALVALLTLSPALAADPPGVLWETTSQMAMAGMPMQMPAQTQKVCSAKTWTQRAPGSAWAMKTHRTLAGSTKSFSALRRNVTSLSFAATLNFKEA